MEISVSTITYFLGFCWSADCPSLIFKSQILFQHLRYINIYIHSADIERCLVVVYLERQNSLFSPFFQLFWSVSFTNRVCKLQHISNMCNVSFEKFQYQHLQNLQAQSPSTCLSYFSRSENDTRSVNDLSYLGHV